MEKVEKEFSLNKGTFYLPHHAVIKESSTTTKLRVVFDGSAKSTSQISVNDILMIGPNIQQDLFTILVKFRLHRYILSADITKMYRQIWIDSEQRDLQRIIWRDHQQDALQTYRLKTVTYGLTSSSYLAIRCLHQLAQDFINEYSTINGIIKNDFYVDDLLTGSDDIDDVLRIRNQLDFILKSGGFTLRKWASNCKQLQLSPDDSDFSDVVNLDKGGETKTLGLFWDSREDVLKYTINVPDKKHTITKRNILSTISQLFDPLGLVNPVIVTAKILIQRLWSIKLDWDTIVPMQIISAWNSFCKDLCYVTRSRF